MKRFSLFALCLVACAQAPSAPPSPPPADAAAPPFAASLGLELVESWPLETALDHADVADAAGVWRAMFDGAKESIDVAELYMSDDPRASAAAPSPLGVVTAALVRAAERGVRVRILLDEGFSAKYPELPARLAAVEGVSLRKIDGKAYGGGILHAKYFVVDGREAYLGSQNYDYRSLSHIHELGVRANDEGVVRGLRATFDRDFRIAGNEPKVALDVAGPSSRVTFGASPEGALPPGVPWDLPMIVRELGAAKREVLVQVLGYKAAFRDGTPWDTLERALRDARARGVAVTLQIGAWHAGEKSLRALEAAGITVRAVAVPPHSSGEIPFSRVIHAKYMVVDRERAWIGTSNWEADYFHKSRNVSVFVDDRAFAERLAAIFADVGKLPPAGATDAGH